MRAIWRIAVLTLLLPAALPAGASAGVADVQTMPASLLVPMTSQARYRAAAGERNVVTVESPSPATWIVRDRAATVIAGAGCTSIDAHAALCRQPTGTATIAAGAIVHAGDGDDQVTGTGDDVEMRGDAGNDTLRGNGRLVGGTGNDTLTGGDRNDALVGGLGRDVLSGGAGPDELTGGNDLFEIGEGVDLETEARDRIDGGSGVDRVSYNNARIVRVDLATGSGGVRGALDVLRAIEDVEGGPGADTLIGDGRRNRLGGGGGRDTIEGRAGDDELDGHTGVDTLLGGAGDDVLRSGERMTGGAGDDRIDVVDPFQPAAAGPAPRVDGGPGDDTISLSIVPAALDCGRGRDVLVDISPDRSVSLAGVDVEPCERLVIGVDALAVDLRPRRSRNALSVAVRCPATAKSRVLGCGGNVTLRLLRPGGAPRTLGRGSFAMRSVARRSVRVALSAGERRLLASTPRPRIAVRVSVTVATPGDPNGPEIVIRYAWSWRVRLAAS